MTLQKKNKIFARLPSAGLGNKMLVWARAFAASHQHGMELFVSPWWGIHPGTWLRGERKKRVYLHYFKEDPLRKRIALFLFRMRSKSIVDPPALDRKDEKTLYIFEKTTLHPDQFYTLKPQREKIREELYRILNPSLIKELDTLEPPVIGIHVRRGDFKRGSALTPEDFFIRSIRTLRELTGKELPVTVFTDADAGELPELLSLPSVALSPAKADILDILLLSRSKVCFLSISSTFSFWAGFLSDGIVLLHPDEWHPAIRPASVNEKHYEGKFDPSREMDLRLKTQLIHDLT